MEYKNINLPIVAFIDYNNKRIEYSGIDNNGAYLDFMLNCISIKYTPVRFSYIYDKNNKPLYENDIIEDDGGRLYIIIFINGGLSIIKKDCYVLNDEMNNKIFSSPINDSQNKAFINQGCSFVEIYLDNIQDTKQKETYPCLGCKYSKDINIYPSHPCWTCRPYESFYYNF